MILKKDWFSHCYYNLHSVHPASSNTEQCRYDIEERLVMPPTLKKLEGHIAFGLSVCVSVCLSVCLCVC